MALPDIKAAVIEHLLASSDITALVSTRIGSVQREAWGAEPGPFVLVRVNGSPGLGNWKEVGFQVTRLDFEFHAMSPDEATQVWRTVHPVICPQQGASQKWAFTISNCRVVYMEQESGPFEILDPTTDQYFTGAAYIAVWAEVAV